MTLGGEGGMQGGDERGRGGFAIRPIRDTEEEAVAELWRTCGLVRAWNDPLRDIARARSNASSEILVAIADEGGVAGSVMAGYEGHRGWVYYVAVAPEWRSQGNADDPQGKRGGAPVLRGTRIPGRGADGDEPLDGQESVTLEQAAAFNLLPAAAIAIPQPWRGYNPIAADGPAGNVGILPLSLRCAAPCYRERAMDSGSDEAIPGLPGAVAARMFETLSSFIASDRLSFGGGTVLAARWNHRRSLDVDLFCEPNAYGALTPALLARMEVAIKAIPGCAGEPTWCDPIATYAEIDGIEVTLLPRITDIEPDRPTRLPGTALALQGSAQILYAKIARRMYETGEIAVRDAYDVACARQFDPEALRSALDRSGPRVLYVVSEVIRRLPRGWSAGTVKPLLEPCFRWSEDDVKEAALAALAAMPPQEGGNAEEPGR